MPTINLRTRILITHCIRTGFRASIGTLDSVTANLPKGGPVVIVTASFEGLPADNAAHFVSWLESVTDAAAFTDLKFAVFGCGNRDWVNTYQRIPRLVDERLAAHGATGLVERGEGDASGSEFFESFDTWEKGLWEKLGAVSCFRFFLLRFGAWPFNSIS